MKKIFTIVCVLVVAFSLSACSKQYTCKVCGARTSNAYYDFIASEDSVLCEDCAYAHWFPYDYRDYRVK